MDEEGLVQESGAFLDHRPIFFLANLLIMGPEH
jgi:hypothetical protein